MKIAYYFYKLLRTFNLITKEKYLEKTAKQSRIHKLVSRSKLFDKAWYKKEYLGNDASSIDSIEHYIHFGFKEGKLPSEHFDAQNMFALPCPEYYYGLHEKRNRNSFMHEHKSENKVENFSFEARKILLISHECSLTGAPRALLNLIKVLHENGMQPVVLAPVFGDLEKEFQNIGVEYYIEPLLMMKLLFQEEKIREFLQSFECIFFNSLESLYYAKYIVSKNKKIAWIHESQMAFAGVDAKLLQEIFAKVDEIYSVTDYAKSFTDKFAEKEKSKVLSLYIDEKHLESKKRSDKKLSFALVGFCCARKGHDVYVQAISNLPKDIRQNCEFKIIGKFGDDKFSKEIKKLAHKESILCVGELSYEDTLIEINKSDVVVCPSRDESLSMVCVEGMMLEKIVICSISTGIASYIKHGKDGFIFDLSTANLIKNIEFAYNNKNSLEEIGKLSKNIYQAHFTKAVFEKNIKDIFFT